ncbi:MAG: hypothetical protein AAF371_07045 [Pseudomonadota bacterium]
MLHDPRPPVSRDAMPFARSSDAQDALLPRQLRLGQPHLGTGGLAFGWLLDECAHRHRWSLADGLRSRPGDLHDAAGHGVITPAVSARVAGFAEAFTADEEVTLALTLEPRAETGWRSEHTLLGEGGGALGIDVVTQFVLPRDELGGAIAQAEMPPHFAPERDGSTARRSRVLRARGREAARAADALEPSVSLSLPVTGGLFRDATGLPCLARLAPGLAAAEAKRVASAEGARATSRELHLLGDIMDGDWLDISSGAGAAVNGRAEILTVARRRSDGLPVALSRIFFGE